MASTEKKTLRSGYTTGACAAAAAKAALLLLSGKTVPDAVEIPLPGGERHAFELCRVQKHGEIALVSIVKDAGDDPDVTNGSEVGVELFRQEEGAPGAVAFARGHGVGEVTKPGLALPVGEAAINPVPRRMILAALDEVMPAAERPALTVRVFVEHGEILAEKTINHRLGIVGGLSILGTTGIVRPISAKAWTDTIEAAMDVARAAGLAEIVLSTGRSSEAAVQQKLRMPEEALVMMGDYLEYALKAAGRHGFARIHLAAMWAKLVKAALAVPQTHVRNGALEVRDAARLLGRLGLETPEVERLSEANTARHIFEELRAAGRDDLVLAVARQAQAQAELWSGLPVELYLVTSAEGVLLHVPH